MIMLAGHLAFKGSISCVPLLNDDNFFYHQVVSFFLFNIFVCVTVEQIIVSIHNEHLASSKGQNRVKLCAEKKDKNEFHCFFRVEK